jgi:predicted nucleic acid-binding protein
MPGEFVDSNVVLYLASANTHKAQISDELLRSGCIISVQVLNEVTNVLRRKYRFSWDDLRIFLAMIRNACEVQPILVETHHLGLNVAERYGFSIYDSMIVASAMQSGCEILFSEDLQHGQVIDGILIIKNPYV